jgi:hypothetical protein
MPVNPNSRMRQVRKAYYGWKKDDGKFCLSIYPRSDGQAKNTYETSRDVLREASQRHLPIIWEDTKAID